ncbi:hypothetical protein SALBM135S_04393 [Streptomyces alboniger]
MRSAAARTLRRMRPAAVGPMASGSLAKSATAFRGRLVAPAMALANATNSRASRACDTGKLVASRSWLSSAETVTRTAAPRRSGAPSAARMPLALESRRVTGYAAPGCAKPTRRSSGRSSWKRSRAFSTPSTALACRARSGVGALAARRFLSWTFISSWARRSKIRRSASGLPPM